MVDLSERVREIKKLVDAGKYFTINRARQYGKTTTLTALRNCLLNEYTVLSLDFQKISKAGFSTEETFVQEFSRLVWNKRKTTKGLSDDLIHKTEMWKDADHPTTRLGGMFDALSEWCDYSERVIILMIDEVDSATNNQVFLDFLAQLRDGYIARDTDGTPTFQSVILAGVSDVKHLKSKIHSEEDSKENSPWNIAADLWKAEHAADPGAIH